MIEVEEGGATDDVRKLRGFTGSARESDVTGMAAGSSLTDARPPATRRSDIRLPCAHADARAMTDKKRRPAKKRPGSHHQSPYFLQPARQGTVTVFRRPAGNRIDAKLCGTMTSRAMALALVKQLEKAESVVHDLFLEATDDGIEALEAVLEACRESVTRRAEQASAPGASVAKGRRARGRRRGGPASRGAERGAAPGDAASSPPPTPARADAEDTSAA